MKSKLISLFAVIFFLTGAMIGGPARAQTQEPEGMGVVTGSSAGTYIQFGKDMARVSAQRGLRLTVKESQGSLANIRRLVSRENAAVGIVQSDVLGFLSRSEDANMRRVAGHLRLIFPFYNEEVHLFARNDITSFEDLRGKRVVVGTKGSGNWLTATNLLHLMGIEPAERLYLEPVAAATAVLVGKADAMFYVAGKPVKLFTNVEQLSDNPDYEGFLDKVHLVPLEHPKMLEEYVAGTFEADDYAWLNRDLPTIAVKAVLVSYDFSEKDTPYFRLRCGQLGQLGNAVRGSINELQQSGHPKWQQVNLDEDVGIWKRDTCSRTAPTETPAPLVDTSEDDFLIRGLVECIRTGKCRE